VRHGCLPEGGGPDYKLVARGLSSGLWRGGDGPEQPRVVAVATDVDLVTPAHGASTAGISSRVARFDRLPGGKRDKLALQIASLVPRRPHRAVDRFERETPRRRLPGVWSARAGSSGFTSAHGCHDA